MHGFSVCKGEKDEKPICGGKEAAWNFHPGHENRDVFLSLGSVLLY